MKKLIAVSVLVLAACGGGDDKPAANAAPTEKDFFAQGIYAGQVTDISGETLEMIAIVGADGTVEAADTYYGNVHYGVLSSSGNEVTGSLRSFTAPGYYWEANGEGVIDTSISFTVSESDQSVIGKTSYKGITQSNFSLLSYPNYYNNPPSSFDEVAGTYNAYLYDSEVYLQITESGAVSGYDTTSCDYNGNLVQPIGDKNLYKLALKVSNCGEFNGSWEGKAFFILPPDQRPLLALTAHSEKAGRAGVFNWVSQ